MAKIIYCVIVLRKINISTVSSFSESLPLVFSLITGNLFFKEPISRKKNFGIILIIFGIMLIVS